MSTPSGVSGPGLGAPLVACEGAGRGRLETSWRDRLAADSSPSAWLARWMLYAVDASEPSYYADEDDHFSYELAREQAAEALWEWRA